MNKEELQKQLENRNKMTLSTYLSIITLNVNGLNALIIDTEWLIGLKTRPCSMLPTRDSLQDKRHTQTESEGMEKGISCK